jgi:hypothetical protein
LATGVTRERVGRFAFFGGRVHRPISTKRQQLAVGVTRQRIGRFALFWCIDKPVSTVGDALTVGVADRCVGWVTFFGRRVHHSVSTKRGGNVSAIGVTGRRVGRFTLFRCIDNPVSANRDTLAIGVARRGVGRFALLSGLVHHSVSAKRQKLAVGVARRCVGRLALFAGLVDRSISAKRQGDVGAIGAARRSGRVTFLWGFGHVISTDSRFGLTIFVASISGNTVPVVTDLSAVRFEHAVATVFDAH